jgi:hypothetical protein
MGAARMAVTWSAGDYIAKTRQWPWDCHPKMEPTDWKNGPCGWIISLDQCGPSSRAGDYDLSSHDLHRASDQGAIFDAVQPIPNLASFLDKIAFAVEDEVLANSELCHTLAERIKRSRASL